MINLLQSGTQIGMLKMRIADKRLDASGLYRHNLDDGIKGASSDRRCVKLRTVWERKNFDGANGAGSGAIC